MKRVLSNWKILLFLLSLSFIPINNASAVENISINLRIEMESGTTLNTDILVPETCEITDSTGATSTHSGYPAICALESAQTQGLLTYQVTDWGFAFAIDSINDVSSVADWSQTWLIYNNFIDPGVGIDGFTLVQGDKLLLTYGPWPMEPLNIQISASSTEINSPVTLTTQKWSGGSLINHEEVSTFWINGTSYTSTSSTLEYIPESEGEIEIYAEAEGKTRSEKIYLTVLSKEEESPEGINNHVIINYLGENIFEGDVLTTSTWFYDSLGELYTNTSTVSALGVLSEASRQGEFPVNITSGWGYYVSSIDGKMAEGFDGWIYNINGLDPGWVAMNDYIVEDGDLLTVFYSLWPWKIESNTTSTNIGEGIIFTAYNYSENEWRLSPSTTISVNATLFVTDENGTYNYSTTATGTIPAFIYGDENWPTNSPIITVEVIEPEASPVDPIDPVDPPPVSGGGDPNIKITQSKIEETVVKILDYFKSVQDGNGKIQDGRITDWVIMSFGANNQYANDIKNNNISLLDFAQNYEVTSATEMNTCAGYPRHILSLLSAGVSPTDEKIIKYTNYTNACLVDGLYGEVGINDDIFALIALLTVGKDGQNKIVQITLNEILNSQSASSGAFSLGWGESADATGASINALKYASSKGLTINNSVFTKAKEYLKNNQNSDGGWGYSETSDIMTTSWAVMGINALDEGQSQWFNSNNKNPWYVLVNNSGYPPETIDWFSLQHAVPALLGKSWPVVLSSHTENYPNPDNAGNNIGSNYYSDYTTTSTPTSTEAIGNTTTSTGSIVDIDETPTSTPEIIADVSGVEEVNDEIVNTNYVDIQPISNAIPTLQPQILGTRISENENISEDSNNSTDEEVDTDTKQNEETTAEKNVETEEEIQTPFQRNATTVFYSSLGVAIVLGGWFVWKFIKTLL